MLFIVVISSYTPGYIAYFNINLIYLAHFCMPAPSSVRTRPVLTRSGGINHLIKLEICYFSPYVTVHVTQYDYYSIRMRIICIAKSTDRCYNTQ